jgi:hypothetical protein
MDKKTEERYFDYILIYVNTILELWEELEEICRKKRWGDTIIKRKKYMYFATKNWVTLVNKNTNLELTFSFNKEKDFIYFEKDNLHSFIESDLNASGLWKNFPPNKTIRSELYNKCLDKLLYSWIVQKKDKW